MNESELVKFVTNELHKTLIKAREIDHLQLDKAPEVAEKDVLGVSEARKATGYVESLGYSLKKMVWS